MPRRVIRSTLHGETHNIQAAAEGGDMIRAAIAHIDNKLGDKELFTTYIWESQTATAMRHYCLTDCDITASTLHNTDNPSGKDKLNIEIRSLRQTLWRTISGERIDPRITDGIPDKTSDRCPWMGTAVMLAYPLTKTSAPHMISAFDRRDY